jgi:hypothetical protein
MDLGRAFGTAVAGASLASGLIIGARALYSRLSTLVVRPEQGPVPVSAPGEPGDEEG